PPTSTIFSVDPARLAARLAELPDEVNPVLRRFEEGRSLDAVLRENEGDDLEFLGVVSRLYFEGILVAGERRQPEGSWFSAPDEVPAPEPEEEPIPEPEPVFAPLPGWESPEPEEASKVAPAMAPPARPPPPPTTPPPAPAAPSASALPAPSPPPPPARAAAPDPPAPSL